MRRALGLEGGASAPRATDRTEPVPRAGDRFAQGHKRRFVQDGEVPVTVVTGRRDGMAEPAPHRGPSVAAAPSRLEAAESALAHETAARHQVERALAEAQAAVHDLQTKLGHAELARTEAVDGLRRERETMAALREELHECQELLHAAERSAQGRRTARATSTPTVSHDGADAMFAPTRSTSGRRGRPPGKKPAPRSKLVRWWLKDESRSD